MTEFERNKISKMKGDYLAGSSWISKDIINNMPISYTAPVTPFPYKKIVDNDPSSNNYSGIKILSKDYPIFLSSKIMGMEKVRKQIVQYVNTYHGFPVLGWEVGEKIGTPQKDSSRDVYLDSLNKSKIYLGILDKKYGGILPDIGISATEDEYNHAVEDGLDLILFVSKNKSDKKLELLKDIWKSKHTVHFYKNIKDIIGVLDKTLENFLLTKSNNWIMIQDSIMNARYSYYNNKITITKRTTKVELIDYFGKLTKDNIIHFIDLKQGFVRFVKFIDFSYQKEASNIYNIEIVFEIFSDKDRVSWHKWKQYKDIKMIQDINNKFDMAVENHGIAMVQGEDHLRQSLLFSTYLNKGDIPMSQYGNNLKSIYKEYSDNLILFQLLAKFDIIEEITGEKGSIVKGHENDIGITCVRARWKYGDRTHLRSRGVDVLPPQGFPDRRSSLAV